MKLKSISMLKFMKRVMETGNLLAMIILQIIYIYTVYLVLRQDETRSYLNRISVAPYKPISAAMITLIAFFIIIILVEMETSVWKSALETVFCIVMIIYSGAIYTGGLFLVIADIAESIKDIRRQIIFVIAMGLMYILANYSVLVLVKPMNSYSEIIHIYSTSTQKLLIVGRDVMGSMNLIIFIVYMILLIRNQMKETDRIRALNDELKEANIKLRDYAEMQKQLGETEERNRIAREIHDTLGHTLTGLVAGLDACETLIDLSVPATKSQIKLLADVTRTGLKEIRRSVNKLRPDALEHSLEDAIQKVVVEMTEMSDVRIDYRNEYGTYSFNADEEEVIFRLVQESITNAIRHGKAKNIWITTYQLERRFFIQVRDDGIGCDTIKPGFGLYHMKERIDMVHGKVEFDGNNGFTIVASIPIRKGERHDKSSDSR